MSEVNSPVETQVTSIILTPHHLPQGQSPGAMGGSQKPKEYDITDLVVAIDINESLFTRIMTGDILVTDGVGLLSGIPIMGQEKITFKIHKGHINSEHKEWDLDLTFYVRAVENVTVGNDFTMSYQLRIVEEAFYLNALQLISQSYTGTVSDIMVEIYDEYLKSPTKPEQTITVDEPTAGLFKCIIPSWSPYAALKWLNRRARSETNDPFFLYNTLFDGMQLKSSKTLFDEIPLNDRTLYMQKEHVPEGPSDVQKGDVLDTQHKVDMAFYFEILETTPVPSHVLNSGYGANYKLLDTSSKTVEDKVWNYSDEFDALPKLSKHKVASDDKLWETSVGEQKKISDYVSNEDVYAFSKDAFDSSEMSFNEDVLNNIPYRNAVQRHLGNFAYKLGIPGDKEIQVGKTINLYINKNEIINVDDADKIKDHRKSGKHIITMIKHRFHLPKMQYTQMIEVNRDTMERPHADEN